LAAAEAWPPNSKPELTNSSTSLCFSNTHEKKTDD
jgi:hypothetical protein